MVRMVDTMIEIRQTSPALQNYQPEKPATARQTPPDTNPAADQVSIGDSPVPEPGTKKKWTFLLYGAGDNDLSDSIERNVDDMEKVGSDANTHLVSQLDLSHGNCKRYYITRDTEHGIHSPVMQDLGPRVDMSDPHTLTDFIVWGAKTFPSQYLALDISDHGGGTAGAVADDRDGSSGMMSPQNLKKAIKDAEEILGRKLDILGFDCCLMANTEVAYELRGTADYLLASEETEGAAGWPYTRVLTEGAIKNLQLALEKRITVEPRDFAVKIVKDAATTQEDIPTLSTVELARMEDVAQKMDLFSRAILDTRTPNADLRSLAAKTQSFSGFRDIHDFTRRIIEADTIKDDALKAACRDVIASLDKAILANQHSEIYPDAHGLQIELPTWGGPSWDYDKLEFAQKTKWAEAVKKIDTKTKGE